LDSYYAGEVISVAALVALPWSLIHLGRADYIV